MVNTELPRRQGHTAKPDHHRRAYGDVALALSAEGKVPDWIELLPAGPVVTGRSGRRWQLQNPAALIDTFKSRGAALPLDFEHASEIKASKGEPAPAAGWIEELAVRDGGSIWGRVEWNERLSGVVIEQLDFEAFIKRYDRPDTLFYLDPPYWGCEDDYGKSLFNRDDFARLERALKILQGRFILSLNDIPEVRELFSSFDIEAVRTRYSINGGKQKQIGEVLISN